MSTKDSARRKNGQYGFQVSFRLHTDCGRIFQGRLGIETLSNEEKEAISENVDEIGIKFFEALAPYLNLDPQELNDCERRPLNGPIKLMGDI